MPAPLVSIITVNFNQAELTHACLESLRGLTYDPVEIIVVDNGSVPGQAEWLRAQHPGVQVIAHPTNDGFAGGNNVGIRAAHGDPVLLLNNDTLVPPGLLEPLVDALQTHPSVGIVSPKIRFHGTDDRIQYAGSTAINPYTGRSANVGYGERDEGQHDTSGVTELGHGAAMMIRGAVFDAIGLLDDTYFLYYEEHDFTEHAKRAGFRVYYEARTHVEHKESMSVGKASPLKAYYMTRNRLLYLRRNVRGLPFVTSVLVFWCLALPKQLMAHAARGETALIVATLRGALWHLTPSDASDDRPYVSSGPPEWSPPVAPEQT